jgi:RNase P subunit RPR2
MSTMLKPRSTKEWTVGDYATNNCPRCRKIVRTRFELRTVQLWRTRLHVPDVLVDVCTECGHMVSFPQQSVEQLREAGRAK